MIKVFDLRLEFDVYAVEDEGTEDEYCRIKGTHKYAADNENIESVLEEIKQLFEKYINA